MFKKVSDGTSHGTDTIFGGSSRICHTCTSVAALSFRFFRHPNPCRARGFRWLTGTRECRSKEIDRRRRRGFASDVMKNSICCLVVCLLGIVGVSAKEKVDAPRGFQSISELDQAVAKAVEKKQLLVVAVKGANDSCPHCTSAMESGEKAVGSGVVKLFARAEALNTADTKAFPSALKERAAKKFTTGASVEYLVFNPEGTKLLASASRNQLDGNSKETMAFKKEVAEQKKALK